MKIRYLLITVAVATAAVIAEPALASGSWGGSSGGSWGGSSGGYASFGGSSGGYSQGGSWGSGGGHVGPLRRLAARIHAHHAARRAAHSHGGSWGGSSGGSWGGSSGGSWGGSSGGSSGGYTVASAGSWGGSSGGSLGGSYSGVGSGYSAYPAASATSMPRASSLALGGTAPYESATISQGYDSADSLDLSDSSVIETAPITSDSSGSGSDRSSAAKPAVESDVAMLTVAVPADSTVTVNDHPTTSEGSIRQFMSEGLQAGFVYTYVVKVTYEQDGEQKTEQKEVKLRAGEAKELSFESNADQVKAVQDDSSVQPVSLQTAASATADDETVTVVRLHVPDQAKVTLAGNPTASQGAVRTFRTSSLKAGERWTAYTVRVVTEVNGQEVAQERTIDVEAGSVNELTFDFAPAETFASR